MTLRNIIFIVAVELVVFFIYFVVANLSVFNPVVVLLVWVLCSFLIVYIIYLYSESIFSFLGSMMEPPPVKPPDFGCVRCQSQRVIIHERMEEGFLHRYFWCKDCGYEWSNIEPKQQIDEEADQKEGASLNNSKT